MMAHKLGKGRRVLLYVNQVYADDLTGQGRFESDLIASLGERCRRAGGEIEIFSVRRRGALSSEEPRRHDLLLQKGSLLGYAAHQIRLLGALLAVLRRRRGDHISIYVRYSPAMIAPLVAAAVGRCRLVFRTGPVLPNLEIHRKPSGRAVRAGVRLLLRAFCGRAAAIVVVTRRIQQWVEQTFPAARGKVAVVHNGVVTSRFRPVAPERSTWGLPKEAFVLGFVGYLYEDQGLDTVIRALSRMREADEEVPWLLVIGDGPSSEGWKLLARSLGVADRVVWAGSCPQEDVPSAIASCDAMLAPFTRRTFEVTGSSALKVFEYIACDRVVLASRSEDHQFIEAEGVGRLVDPEDVVAWAAAIRSCARERPALGGRGRALATERYGMEVIAERIWGLCHPENGTR